MPLKILHKSKQLCGTPLVERECCAMAAMKWWIMVIGCSSRLLRSIPTAPKDTRISAYYFSPVAIKSNVCVLASHSPWKNENKLMKNWWLFMLSSESLGFGDETLSVFKGATFGRFVFCLEMTFHECKRTKSNETVCWRRSNGKPTTPSRSDSKWINW